MNQPKLSSKAKQQFAAAVYAYYKAHGRHTLPWRKTRNPYRVLVSEMMLQQTQVDRVLPKYRAFMKQFPTVATLAAAPLRDVLVAWQGLGYNRRAKFLHACAQTVVHEHRGRFPRTQEKLEALPGIGPYTAAAVMAFAYNEPVSLIETNVRTVFLHHFFRDAIDVSDADILSLVTATLDTNEPRIWYWALMDYGAYLKRTIGNVNTKSKHYTKQSTFNGSDRQIRGAIVRLLSGETTSLSRLAIHQTLTQFTDLRIDAQLEKLTAEGLLVFTRGRYRLPQ